MRAIKTLITLAVAAMVFAAGASAYPVSDPAGPIASVPVAKETKIKTKAKAKKKKKPANHDLWVRIGRCEQPGRGYMGVNWSHRGPTYMGGLGFWYGTWASFKESWMPSNAGDASWRAQMIVANKLYARYGVSPWGCG